MSTQESQLQQMKPYLILSGILVVLILVVVFWPSDDSPSNDDAALNGAEVEVEAAQAISDPNDNITDMVEPKAFEPVPRPVEVEIGGNADEVDDFEAQEIVVDVPVDFSDATVKNALMEIVSSPAFGSLLVNDRLLDKFVINVNNLANEDMSPKDALLVAPDESFDTVKRGDSTFVDEASFRRYTPYVSVLESMNEEDLLEVYSTYEGKIKEKFAEISRPNQDFDEALMDAIDVMLATPEVDYPLEVYSESVVYKFKDPALESLPGPQKQLIRTGPENMQRIKNALRSLKSAIESKSE